MFKLILLIASVVSSSSFSLAQESKLEPRSRQADAREIKFIDPSEATETDGDGAIPLPAPGSRAEVAHVPLLGLVSYLEAETVLLSMACQWQGTGFLGTGLFPADHSCAGTLVVLRAALVVGADRKLYRIPFLGVMIQPVSEKKLAALGRSPIHAGEYLDPEILPVLTGDILEVLSLARIPNQEIVQKPRVEFDSNAILRLIDPRLPVQNETVDACAKKSISYSGLELLNLAIPLKRLDESGESKSEALIHMLSGEIHTRLACEAGGLNIEGNKTFGFVRMTAEKLNAFTEALLPAPPAK